MWLFVLTAFSCICLGFFSDVSSRNAESMDEQLNRLDATVKVLANNSHDLLILVQKDRSEIDSLINQNQDLNQRLFITADRMEKLVTNEEFLNQTIQALQTLTSENQRELNKEKSMSKKLTRNYNDRLFKVNREVNFLKKLNHDLERKLNTTEENMEKLMSETETSSQIIENIQDITSQHRHELNKAKSESKRSRLSLRSSLTSLNNSLQKLTNSTSIGFNNLNGSVLKEKQLFIVREEMLKFENTFNERNNKRLGKKDPVCQQPKQTGPCSDYAVKYFFNTTSRKCEKFWYGGCQGNQNNFESDEECHAVCVQRGATDLQKMTKDVIDVRTKVTELESTSDHSMSNITVMTIQLDKISKDLKYLKGDAVLTCRSEKFTCTKDFQCIPARKKCDGFADCSDKTDEKGCVTITIYPKTLRRRVGSKATFSCNIYQRDTEVKWYRLGNIHDINIPRKAVVKNGRLTIPNLTINDAGEYVCSGNFNYTTYKKSARLSIRLNTTFNCRADQFACSRQLKCINADKICDGISDCSNGNDEEDCANLRVIPKEVTKKVGQDAYFKCQMFPSDSTLEWYRYNNINIQTKASVKRGRLRVPDLKITDSGDYICSGIYNNKRYTELAKLVVRQITAAVDPCPDGQHTCRNGQCIPSGYRCDGDRDCDDNSDEDRCIDTVSGCESNEFKCKNDRCTMKIWRCDGDDDCGDNSDEEYCELGKWTGWLEEGCSVTCGIGVRVRHRQCSNPYPKYDGKKCTGNDTEQITCTQPICIPEGSLGCYKGWIKREDFGASYCFSRKTSFWYTAQEECRKHNASLADINSETEALWLADYSRNISDFNWHVWIGGKKERGVIKWFTSDGESKHMNFTRWALGEPSFFSSISLQYCVCLYQYNQYYDYWAVFDCAFGLNFICKIYL